MNSLSEAQPSLRVRRAPVELLGPIAQLYPIVTMECWKLVKRRLWWIALGCVTSLTGLILVLGYIFARTSQETATVRGENLSQATVPGGFGTSLEISQLLVRLVIPLIAALLIGSEYRWNTMRVLLATGVRRRRLLVSKFLVVVVVGGVLLAVGLLSGSVAAFAVTIAGGHDLTLTSPDVREAALLAVWALAGVSLAGLLAFTASTLARSSAAGIVAGLLWPFADTTMARLFDGQATWIESVLFTPNLSVLRDYAVTGDNGTGALQSAGILALYVVTLFLISIVAFDRHATSAGGD